MKLDKFSARTCDTRDRGETRCDDMKFVVDVLFLTVKYKTGLAATAPIRIEVPLGHVNEVWAFPPPGIVPDTFQGHLMPHAGITLA